MPSQPSAATRARGPPRPTPRACRPSSSPLTDRGLLPKPCAPSDSLPGAECSSSRHGPALGPASSLRAQGPDREACPAHLLLAAFGALGHRLVRGAAVLDDSPANARGNGEAAVSAIRGLLPPLAEESAAPVDPGDRGMSVRPLYGASCSRLCVPGALRPQASTPQPQGPTLLQGQHLRVLQGRMAPSTPAI